MSYIDTIRHEFIGQFNGLPIYHPIETTPKKKWGAYDFSCSPENLVLGGGAGEHPGLVLHKIGAMVAEYIVHSNDFCQENGIDRLLLPDSTVEQLVDIYLEAGEQLEFCGWSIRQSAEFLENSKSHVNSNPLQEGMELERWIRLSFGEFAYISMPDIDPVISEINDLEGMDYWAACLSMRNVFCLPPNYVKTKKQSLQDDAFREYGFFRWDYKYPPEE